jgi:hypothetical protein
MPRLHKYVWHSNESLMKKNRKPKVCRRKKLTNAVEQLTRGQCPGLIAGPVRHPDLPGQRLLPGFDGLVPAAKR